MYNVLEKHRTSEPLTDKEKEIHEQGLVSILKQIHDELDAAVFDAYGWPTDLTGEQILEKLVALNAERAADERNGVIRWLRPEFQNPSGTREATQTAWAGLEASAPDEAAPVKAASWPKKLPDQLAAVRDLLLRRDVTWDLEQVARTFKGAKRKDVEAALEALTMLGLLLRYQSSSGRRWKGARATATG